MLRRPRKTNPIRLSATAQSTTTNRPRCGKLLARGAACLLAAYAVAGSWWCWTLAYRPRRLREALPPKGPYEDSTSIGSDLPQQGIYPDTISKAGNDTHTADLERWVERLSRAYNHVPTLPCLEAEPRWFGATTQQTPTPNGLLFVKPYKTAGSTAAGVHLRIAVQLARDYRQSTKKQWLGSPSQEKKDMCKVRFDHSVASRMGYGARNRDGTSSFLWSIVRDPTSRAVSHYHHFVVGRHNVPATDETFRRALRHPNLAAPSSYYLRILALEDGGYDRLSLHPPDKIEDAVSVIQGIVEGYDFLAVTERFDESMVALQLLTGVSMSSVLYLSAKRGGGYDDGGGKKTCVQIPPHTDLTPGMREYLESHEWSKKIQFDQLLHRVANRSLDRTIDEAIGRVAFERQLERYLKAQHLAQEKCLSRAVFPCDAEGRYRNDSNCIWKDSGCGNECLDEVASETNLW